MVMSPEILIDDGLNHAWVHQANWNGLAEPGGLLIFEKGSKVVI